MLKLSEVRSVLREHGIHPSKRLGQNFLVDQNIKNKIINSIEMSDKDDVVEIGPGLGALTESLCVKVKKLTAIEKDTRLYDILKEALAFDNLELINGDVLKYVFENRAQKIKIIGNLPYYISSPILNHLIENKSCIDSAYITVQKEFARRVVAGPGTKDYSSLSCYAQFYTEPKILFDIPKGAFFPVPEVDSCFLKISFEKYIDSSIDQEMFFKIIRSSFEKRRKTILNSLASSGIFESKESALACLTKARISPDRRPETISLREFAKLLP